ncbi:MAG TPA: hypothetical protein PK509_13125 [Catalimonadaceae bacterium]|nr:hypothetical protein [Catalimonadaceae bacterium]HPI11440.1 hypothetical protein [Catalimonadaceae bacterium]
MKTTFLKTLRIFKYLAIAFTVILWIYMIYDDWIFIEEYVFRLVYFGLWFLYYVVYLLGFSFYFWAVASIAILGYHKLWKRSNDS